MLCKFRGIEFNAQTFRYGRSIEMAEADFLADDDKSQSTELDNVDFAITGFIYGKEVEKNKIALESALEKKSGILILPDGRQASVEIADGGYHIEQDREKEGYYDLDLNFKKRDKSSLALKVMELSEVDENKIAEAAAETEKSILEQLNENFTFEGFPQFVRLESLNNVLSLTSKLSKLSADNLIGDQLNPALQMSDILKSSVSGIGKVISSYLNFGKSKNSFNAKISASQLKTDYAAPIYPTKSNLQIIENSKATESFVNQTALLEAINQAANDMDYNDNKEAQEIIDQLLETSKEVLYNTDSFEIQDNLNNVLNLGINYIHKKHMLKVKKIKFNKSIPAIVITHMQYGTKALEAKTDDVIGRNHIRHALFTPAGKEMEVLDV